MRLVDGVDQAPVAVTSRSGFDESVHFGIVVALGTGGDVVYTAGDPEALIYPRSALKPLQAAGMLACGLQLPDDQLAVVCASHDGTDHHCDTVRAVLAGAGLSEAALGNVAALPLHEPSACAVVRAGGGPSPIRMNCSGKHAGMLATCVANGWSIHDYLAPEHPLQRAITDEIDRSTGGVGHVGTDGCGAPAHVVGLLGLTRAFAGIAAGDVAGSGAVVGRAMTTHPELVGGDRRYVTMLMRGVPGLVAKDGAEGVCVAALPDGRAVGVKIADGAARAVPAVVLHALSLIGVDTASVPAHVSAPVLGNAKPVGDVRSVLPPTSAR